MTSPLSRCARALLLAAMPALLMAPAVRATCYAQDCDLACGASWPNITELVAPGDYPNANHTAIVFVDPADGVRHRFIATQEGVIWVWDAAADQILATPFLDLTAKVEFSGERGLLALAVDPDYATNGFLYVYYTRASAVGSEVGDIVVERYTRQSTNVGDPNSASQILVLDHPASNHNGGWLAFGPDGMLYVSIGDGGGGCDSTGPNGQNVNSLKGKLLRLDVRNADPAAGPPECAADVLVSNYEVPTGGPFVGAGVAGCGEIWALGLRNPFRFSFDRANGDIWIGDVGQANWEEINWMPAAYLALDPSQAMNFGWRCREGCGPSSAGASGCSIGGDGCPAGYTSTSCSYPAATGLRDPAVCHDNRFVAGSDWQSIIGGRRYRGSRIASLAGRYLYGDVSCGQLWATTSFDPADPTAATSACWDAGNGFLYEIAEDVQGELYLVFGSGSIRCLHDGAGCPWAAEAPIFSDGFESGDVTAWSDSVP